MSTRRSLDLGFDIHLGWGARRETPEDVARRFLTAIDRFRSLHRLFEAWWDWTDLSNIVPLSKNPSEVAARIAASFSCDEYGRPLHGLDDGEVVEVLSYPIRAANHPQDVDRDPRNVMLEAWSGTDAGGLTNTVHFDIGSCVGPDPELSSYSMVHGVMSQLIDAFEVDYGSAFPAGLVSFWTNRLGEGQALLEQAWLSYIGPRFTHLVAPPASALVERRTNGGMLLSATLERFDEQNTGHRAVATEIASAASAFRWSSIGQ